MRFRTANLTIEPSLTGAAHTFDFEEKRVSVTLPPAPRQGREDSEVISLESWQEVNGEKVPLQYSIYEIAVVVSISDSYNLPIEMLDRPPNAYDLLSDVRQQTLKSMAEAHYATGERAFDRWARTMRWKTDQWSIARSRVEGVETGWGSVLRQEGTDKRLWVHHNPIVIHLEASVTADQWNFVQSTLLSSEQSPIFVDLLLDAEMHLAASDIRRAIIDAAVAAETFMRSIVQRTLPTGLGDRVREIIDEANVRRIMNKAFPESLALLGASAVDKDTMSDIHKLLDVRNKLLHTGLVIDIDAIRCSKYLKAVRKMLSNVIEGKEITAR